MMIIMTGPASMEILFDFDNCQVVDLVQRLVIAFRISGVREIKLTRAIG